MGLLGLILVKILAPGFYARQIMTTPVKIAFVTVLVSQTLALILMFPLGHAGLTLSTSIGACLNAGLLFWFLQQARHLRARGRAGCCSWRSSSSRCSCSPRCCCWLGGPASFWLAASLWAKVGRLAGVCAAGAAAYFGALWLLGFRLADFNRRDIAAEPRRPIRLTPRPSADAAALQRVSPLCFALAVRAARLHALGVQVERVLGDLEAALARDRVCRFSIAAS